MNLESICLSIVDAEHKTAPRTNEGFPSIRTPNIGKGRLKLDGVYRVSKETYNKWTRRAIPEANDLILAREAPVGNVAIIPENIDLCLGQRTVLIKPDKEKVNPHFLCYYLLSNEIQNKMKSKSGGATVSHLNMKDIRELELTFIPSIEKQKRIADILTSYDDLIENNLKRIKLLEQAAQNIYKEWFVNMRFPGHENTTTNSETGLPEGWGEKGICEFNSFKQYKSKIKPFEGEKEYLATANVNGIAIEERGDSFTYENKPSRAQIHPPLNSIWFARMSETDKVLFITEKTNNDFMISSGFAGFKAEKKEVLPFLFCLINNSKFSKLKDANATGSTQVSINNKSLNSIKFIEPTYEMIEKFGALNYDSLEFIQHLFKANEKLKLARDVLLPRLMNQTIEV